MAKKFVAGAACGFMLSSFTGVATATLLTIGTATYNGADYNLIWEDDNNRNSVVWLDYTNAANTWVNQNAWAASLDGLLTYSLNVGYSVNWSEDDWRLPSTVDGLYEFGMDGTTTGGFYITSSEMGYLYYTEFGYEYDDPAQVENNSTFSNLSGAESGSFYWSATGYLGGEVGNAWRFDMWNGDQNAYDLNLNHLGLAVRTADVVYNPSAPVPEPATILLFGTGLVGLLGAARRRKKN